MRQVTRQAKQIHGGGRAEEGGGAAVEEAVRPLRIVPRLAALWLWPLAADEVCGVTVEVEEAEEAVVVVAGGRRRGQVSAAHLFRTGLPNGRKTFVR